MSSTRWDNTCRGAGRAVYAEKTRPGFPRQRHTLLSTRGEMYCQGPPLYCLLCQTPPEIRAALGDVSLVCAAWPAVVCGCPAGLVEGKAVPESAVAQSIGGARWRQQISPPPAPVY